LAVEHLKKTIHVMAGAPAVKRVNPLAHRRGTDVLPSARAFLISNRRHAR